MWTVGRIKLGLRAWRWFSNIKYNEGTVDEFGFISPIPPVLYPKVKDHMDKYFYKDEAMNRMLGLEKCEDALVDFHFHTVSVLEEGLSLLAVHMPTEKLAAASLNGVVDPNETHVVKKNQKLDRLFLFFEQMRNSLNLLERYGVTKIFDLKMVAVNEEFRQQKLACQVINRSENIARRNGFELMVADGTSLYSQKIFENLGYQEIWSCKYENIPGQDDQWHFKPIPPHYSLKVYTKKLEPEDK